MNNWAFSSVISGVDINNIFFAVCFLVNNRGSITFHRLVVILDIGDKPNSWRVTISSFIPSIFFFNSSVPNYTMFPDVAPDVDIRADFDVEIFFSVFIPLIFAVFVVVSEKLVNGYNIFVLLE